MALVFKSYPALVSCAFNPIPIRVQTPAARYAQVQAAAADSSTPGFQLLTTSEGEADIQQDMIALLKSQPDGSSANGFDPSDLLNLHNNRYVLQIGAMGFTRAIAGGRITLQVDWAGRDAIASFCRNGEAVTSLDDFHTDSRSLALGALPSAGGTLATRFVRFIEQIGDVPQLLTKGAGMTFNLLPADIHGLCAAFAFVDESGHASGFMAPASAADHLIAPQSTHEMTIRTGADVVTRQTIFRQPFGTHETGDYLALYIDRGKLEMRCFQTTIDFDVAPDTIYHVAATLDTERGDIQLFIDGRFVGSEPGQLVDSYEGELFIGCDEQGAAPFLGQLGQYRFFNLDIGAPWIQRLYNGGDPRAFAVSQLYESKGAAPFTHGLVLEIAPWSCFDPGNFWNSRGPVSFAWEMMTSENPTPLYIEWQSGEAVPKLPAACELRVDDLMVYIQQGDDFAFEPMAPAEEAARMRSDGVETQQTIDPLKLLLHIVDEDGTTRDVNVEAVRDPDAEGNATFDISYLVRRLFSDATDASRLWGSYEIVNDKYNQLHGVPLYAANAVRQLGYPSPFSDDPLVLIQAPEFVRYSEGEHPAPQQVAFYNPTGGTLPVIGGTEDLSLSEIFGVFPIIGPAVGIGEHRIPVERGCVPDFPVFVRWVNTIGGYEHAMFTRRKDFEVSVSDVDTIESAASDENLLLRTVSLESKRTVLVGSDALDREHFLWLRGLQMSPRIEMYNYEISAWQAVAIDGDTTTSWSSASGVGSVEYRFFLPPLQTQF